MLFHIMFVLLYILRLIQAFPDLINWSVDLTEEENISSLLIILSPPRGAGLKGI